MTGPVDESRLDDPAELARLDPGGMLRAVATAGAQVRESARSAGESPLATVAADGRPRAVVVAGMGGSGIAGDMLMAVTGTSCPIPVVAHKDPRLPGWVGAMDLVVGVSCSGSTKETLAATDEALRRGARVVTVGRADSPLSQRADGARAVHVPIDPGGRMPRANLWALSVPLLVLADDLGLASVPAGQLARVADELDRISEECGPVKETYENPGKRLALELADHLAVVWGSSPLTGVAAHRFVCQLAENAKSPAVDGVLPEVAHNQIVSLAGPFGGLASGVEDDIFRDRIEETAQRRLRVLIMRDTEEVSLVSQVRQVIGRLADSYGVLSTELAAQGEHPLERLASLIAPTDFASVYLALAQGIDPTPIEPIVALKEQLGA